VKPNPKTSTLKVNPKPKLKHTP